MTIWNSLVIHALPALTKQQIVNLVPVDGLSCLDDHLAAGRPVLVWCYHFGVHHLIVAALLHARGYPIHVVAHALHMPAGASVFQRFYLRRLQRISGQFPMIDPQEGPERTMLDVFRSKQCLCITPDYMIPEAQPRSAFEVPVDFLGHRACLHTGGLRLAKRFHAGVVTILSVQQDDHERRLIVEPFDLPTVGFTPVELQRDLQMCMQRLEAQVLAYPCLWWDLKRDDLLERLEVIPCDDQPA
jgi:KDO2-lipid IV(A) lauroyltransferase